MRTVRLHDTRTGGPVELRAGDGGRVGIYACGPTVYSRVHVGNARPYVVFSLLARFLRHDDQGDVVPTDEPLWWPATKIAGRHLAPYLASHLDLAAPAAR